MRVLLVDDEPLARKRVRRFLRTEADFEVLEDCENGEQAIAAIGKYSPDVIFLDVQMPSVSGFDVINAIGAERMPFTVFTTAYDQYAIRAFEAQALDYLLKPISRIRFQAVLERVRGAVRQKRQQLDTQLFDVLLRQQVSSRSLTRILIKSEGRTVVLNAGEIDWIQAEGNYVRVNTGTTSHLLRQTLAHMEGHLDANRFLRIHRSTIVNIDRVNELRPASHGDFVLLLRDGKRLRLSRTYRDQARKFLKQDF